MLPPTERLCDPIEGTSRSILAQHFGLDASKYAQASYSGMSLDEDLIGYTPSTQMPDKQRYRDCKKFIVTCPDCKESTSFNGIYFVESSSTTLKEAKSGLICSACNTHRFSLPHLTNMLDMSIRQLTLEYYEGWSECTESTCNNKTRQCSCLGGVCIVPQCGSNTNEIFSAGSLYTQLKYYETLFDVKKYGEILKEELGFSDLKACFGEDFREQLDDFKQLKARVTSHLATCDYQWIRPNMWQQVFGGSTSGGLTSGSNKRVHA
jgi:DNA polymerase alpha subunit A